MTHRKIHVWCGVAEFRKCLFARFRRRIGSHDWLCKEELQVAKKAAKKAPKKAAKKKGKK